MNELEYLCRTALKKIVLNDATSLTLPPPLPLQDAAAINEATRVLESNLRRREARNRIIPSTRRPATRSITLVSHSRRKPVQVYDTRQRLDMRRSFEENAGNQKQPQHPNLSWYHSRLEAHAAAVRLAAAPPGLRSPPPQQGTSLSARGAAAAAAASPPPALRDARAAAGMVNASRAPGPAENWMAAAARNEAHMRLAGGGPPVGEDALDVLQQMARSLRTGFAGLGATFVSFTVAVASRVPVTDETCPPYT